MTPQEIFEKLEKFKSEVAPLTGDALLDKWIEFDGSDEEKEPDLGVLKSGVLEVLLIQTFGHMEWHKKIEERRKTKQDASRT